MSVLLWRKLDLKVLQNRPYYIKDSDHCYYAREYISRGGYEASGTNQLIMNFKKDPIKKSLAEWHYKLEAQKKFAEELATILPLNAEIAAIPTSKNKNDSAYDSRFEETFKILLSKRDDVLIRDPLYVPKTVPPLHLTNKGSERSRSVNQKYTELALNKEELALISANYLYLIDDVITTGASFKASQQLLTENFSGP